MDGTYPWQAAFHAVILETDPAAMPLRVFDALSAIEERRLRPVDPGSDEERALENAKQSILTLKAERVGSFEAQ